MHAVPVLVVKSPVKGLLHVNGTMVCEVDGAASLPVSPTGTAYLLFVPYGDHLPIAAKLGFSAGAPLLQDSPAELVSWPNGVTEVLLKPHDLNALRARRIIDTLKAGDCTVSLVKDEGVSLVCERTDDDLEMLSLAAADAQTGSLRLLAQGGGTPAALFTLRNGLQRLVLLSVSEQSAKVALDVTAKTLTLDDATGEVTGKTPLSDAAEHVVTARYRKTGSGYDRPELTYARPEGKKLTNPADIAMALAQAVLLEQRDEAMGYLSPTYTKSIGYDQLTQFFGLFERVEEARYCPDVRASATLALLTNTAENVWTAKVFAFDFDQDGISSISRYEG